MWVGGVIGVLHEAMSQGACFKGYREGEKIFYHWRLAHYTMGKFGTRKHGDFRELVNIQLRDALDYNHFIVRLEQWIRPHLPDLH